VELERILMIVAAVVVVALILKKKSKKGGGRKKSVSIKGRATQILPSERPGYFAVEVWQGQVFGGTYALNRPQTLRRDGAAWPIPATESIYQMVPDGDRLLLCCEHSGGKLFQLRGGAVSTAWSGGLHTTISAFRAKGRLFAVSTRFDEGGVMVHDTGNNRSVTLSDGKTHARQGFEYEDFAYIIGFDYSRNMGGWWISADGNVWNWRDMMPGIRPLKAAIGDKVYLACSPYNGQRIPPATIMSWDGRNLEVEHRQGGHAMFMGIAADGSDWFAGSLTNWRGSGNAVLVHNGKVIWTAPHPEIPDLCLDKGVLYAATRNERGVGGIWRIT